MSSSINNRLEAIRRVSSRTPAYSILNIVAIDNIKNRVTGETYGSFEDAVQALEQYSLVDYRRFGSEAFSMGQNTGAGALESEMMAINRYLSSPGSKAALKAKGLGHLHGQKLDLAFMQFNFGGNAKTLASLMDPNSQFGKYEGTVTASDEGLMRASYMLPGAERSLTALQQSTLKSLAGVPAFRPEFVKKIFSNISRAAALPDGQEKADLLQSIADAFGKIPKRQTRSMSPRDLSIDTIQLNNMLSRIKPAGKGKATPLFEVDKVDLLLRRAAGDTSISPLEEVLLASTGGFEKPQIVLTQEEAMDQVLRYAGLKHPLQEVDPDNFSDELAQDLKAAFDELTTSGSDKTLYEIIEENVNPDYLIKHGNEKERRYGKLIKHLKANIETSDDGTVTAVGDNFLRMHADAKSQYNALKAALEQSGDVSPESLKKLKELANQVELTEEMVKRHGLSTYSLTFGFEGGTVKAKVGVDNIDDRISNFIPGYTYTGKDKRKGPRVSDAIRELEEKAKISGTLSPEDQRILNGLRIAQAAGDEASQYLFIVPKQNIKRELGSREASFISLNIAKSHESVVYTDPMDLLVNPEAMNPEVQRAIQANLDEAAKRVQEFLGIGGVTENTGKVPKEVLASLQYQLKQTGSSEISESLLTPAARALQIKNRQQVQRIVDAMKLSPDPRSIPELVQMVIDHFNKTAFRTKDDAINLAIPFTTRKDIRTFESEGAIVPGVNRSGIEVQNMRMQNGKVVQVPLVQTAHIGDKAMTTGPMASAFKGLASGYDMDDTFIQGLHTFINEKGVKKLAIRASRDPKGLEEDFFQIPTLQHARTVQSLVGEADTQFSRGVLGGIASPTISDQLRQQVFIDSKLAPEVFASEVDNVYSTLRMILAKRNGTFSLDTSRRTAFFAGEASYTIAETMLRVLMENSGGASIPSMPDKTISRLAELKTSGFRARNAIDPATGMTVQVARGLGPEQAGQYNIPNFQELAFRSASSEEIFQQSVDEINKLLPSGTSIKLSELEAFIQGRLTIPGVSPEDAVSIGTAAMEKINVDSIMEGILNLDPRNTIGVSSNRAAIIAGSQDMIQGMLADKTILQQFGRRAEQIAKVVNQRYSLGTIAPSNVVDLVKQVSGGNILIPLSEVTGTPEQLAALRVAYDAIAKIKNRRDGTSITADTIHKFNIGDILEAGIAQAGKYVGWMRGAAIAAGKTEGELPGFDPVAYKERIKGAEDISQMHENIVQGMREFLSDATGTVSASDRMRVRRELEKLEGLSVDEFGKALSLKPDTPAYNRYAQTAIAKDIATNEQIRQRSIEVQARKNYQVNPRALGVSAYREETRKFLNLQEIKKHFATIEGLNREAAKAIAKGETPAMFITADRMVAQKELSQKMAVALRAIRDNYPSRNILDVMDTLEAETVSMFGQSGVKLFDDLGAVGAEDEMMKIHALAQRRRRMTAQTTDVKHFNYIQDLYRDHQGSAAADLSRVTVQQARDLVRYDRNIKAPLRRMNPELFDFMTLVSRGDDQLKGRLIESESAKEAAKEFRKIMEGQAIEQELATLESAATTSGIDPDDIKRLAGEIGEDADPDVVGRALGSSPYKRITESFNHGELGKLLESKNVRRSGIAAIALIGASFLYQRNKKKDLTESDVAGPPLLPGGSAYDDRPPTREMIIQSAQAQSQGYGMQYQVNTTGSMNDLNRLRGLFGDVVDGPINATMYNGMPTLGKDPYSDIASNF